MVRANTMDRKTRSDKKGITCKHCGQECSTPQKLHEYLKRKNLCKLLQDQKKIADGIDGPKRIPPTLIPFLLLKYQIKYLFKKATNRLSRNLFK